MSLSNLFISGGQTQPNKDIYCDSITANSANIGSLSFNQDYWYGTYVAENVPHMNTVYRLTLTEDSSSGTSISVASQTITFNEAGLYMIHWFGLWAPNAVGDRMLYIIDPTFTNVYGQNMTPASAAESNPCEVSALIRATAGQQIQLLPYQTSTLALAFQSASSVPQINIVKLN